MTQTGARKNGKGAMIVCLAPDVCKTPVGNTVVPIPYMILSKLEWAQRTSTDVKFAGEEAFTTNSRTDKVVGDEPGTVGGVKSSVNRGWCRPKTNKSSFKVNGYQLLQNDNIFEMNCSGPEGPGNTVGRLIYYE